MVWPIISGMTVERRDQVLITVRELVRFKASTFLAKWPSIKGPFFTDLAIFLSLPGRRDRRRARPRHALALLLPATNYKALGAFIIACLIALGRLTPGRHRMRITLTGFALAAAVRVIHGIHHHAA